MSVVWEPVVDTVRRLMSPPPDAQFGSHPYTILASIAVCAGTLLFLQNTRLLLPRRVQLKKSDELEWNLRVVSTLHAITLVIGAVMCYVDSLHYTREDIVHGYSWPPDFFARIFIGYLIYDLLFMLIYHPVLKDNSGIIHHLIFIPVTAYVLAHSIYKFPFVWLSFCEVSTPFLNLRWRLAVLEKKNSSIYLYNGILMMVLFFVARILFYGMGLFHLCLNWDLWATPKHPLGYKLIVLLFAAGYVLNCYWMWLIFAGVLRAVKGQHRKKVA